MAHAAAAAPRFYAAPVRGGALAGGFVPVDEADPEHDVWAFLARIKASHSELKDVNVDKLLLYGPWASADAVPEDVAAATHDGGASWTLTPVSGPTPLQAIPAVVLVAGKIWSALPI